MNCHGNCLGLRLAAIGSHRQDVYEQLTSNLYQNDAVTSEAAEIAMVMLRSKSMRAIEDMVAVSMFTTSYK
ncbi:26S proteasome non-ATPase regulatory subunit 1 [Trachymyrmex zeteki]|uniref:26S proteasome non-ATPase regulatory subunit 1 n=1 Tax=Mycetomoellerius zeteki TaxID=64791 RepID=A0A151XJF5_9HYME|nr:26S proteasome non-ATPase regulatory subunit 1 [Trachymyrmex zeteki]